MAQTWAGSARSTYNISFSSRAFDAPLFGNRSSNNFSFFGREVLRSGIELTGYAYSGFPNATTSAGLQVDRIRFLGGDVSATLGDLAVSRLQPEGFTPLFADTFPLQGAQVQWQSGNHGALLYAGVSKFAFVDDEAERRRPFVAGGEYLARFGRNHVAVAVTAIADPTYADATDRSSDAFTRVSYIRVLSPNAILFADGYAGNAAGFRLGGRFNFQLGQATAAVYHFDSDFPVLSIFRPGERGVETSGFYRLTDLSTISGQLYYASEQTTRTRDELRGQLGYSKSFGSNAPFIYIAYAREQFTIDALTGDVSRLGDRFSAAVTKSSQVDYWNVSLDHVMYRVGEVANRTQLLGTAQHVIRSTSFLDTSLLTQIERGEWGATLESAVESAWRGPYYTLYGLGAAYRSAPFRSGEGVLRLGLTRRIAVKGVFGRAEIRIPFDVGLRRSRLNRNTLLFDIGSRFGAQDLRNLHALFAPLLSPNQYGSIDGRVVLQEEGVSGVTILLNGQPRTESGAGGVFRIHRVPIGSATVGLEITDLESGVAVVGGESVDVVVQPRTAAVVEFKLGRFSMFRGSIVLCEGDRPRAIPGAKLALIANDVAIPLEVSASGSFQAADVPPGRYDILVDPSSIPAVATSEVPRMQIDLTHDVLSYVIALRCPEGVIARAAAPAEPPAGAPEPPEVTAPETPTAIAEIPPGVTVTEPAPQTAEISPPVEPRPEPEFSPPTTIGIPSPAPAVAPQPAQVPAAPVESSRVPAMPTREAELRRASVLVAEEQFRSALEIFERLAPISEPQYRFAYAVALYELGRYRDAKREIAEADVPATPDAERYVAKIQGAIVW